MLKDAVKPSKDLRAESREIHFSQEGRIVSRSGGAAPDFRNKPSLSERLTGMRAICYSR
jgi:hypothetical protein